MEDFVPFELAVKLKEKGFDWETSDMYERNIIACRYENYPKPTISQVLKWLREKKNIFMTVNIGYCYENDESVSINTITEPTIAKGYYVFKGYYFGAWELYNLNDKNISFKYFESPELAAIAGIEYILDNLI